MGTTVPIVDIKDDDEVMIVNKSDVIDFDALVSTLATESEQSTLNSIRSQFGKRRLLQMTKLVISVKDSYSQCRIAVPVRGRACPHLQPFDARSFLLRPKKYQKCTHCNKRVCPQDLLK